MNVTLKCYLSLLLFILERQGKQGMIIWAINCIECSLDSLHTAFNHYIRQASLAKMQFSEIFYLIKGRVISP